MVHRPTPPDAAPSGRSAFGFVGSRTGTGSGLRPTRASLPPFPPDLPVPGRPPGYRPAGDPADPVVAPHSFLPDPGLAGDLHERLLLQRRILVNGFLDDTLATRTAAELMYLDGSGDDPIELHLSCPDGELGAANALADTLDLVGVEVRATCLGVVGGPALGPFTAATHRTASMSATFHLRDAPSRRPAPPPTSRPSPPATAARSTRCTGTSPRPRASRSSGWRRTSRRAWCSTPTRPGGTASSTTSAAASRRPSPRCARPAPEVPPQPLRRCSVARLTTEQRLPRRPAPRPPSRVTHDRPPSPDPSSGLPANRYEMVTRRPSGQHRRAVERQGAGAEELRAVCGITGEVRTDGSWADTRSVGHERGPGAPRTGRVRGVGQRAGGLRAPPPGHHRPVRRRRRSRCTGPTSGSPIVFNGCIYNYHELRAELQRRRLHVLLHRRHRGGARRLPPVGRRRRRPPGRHVRLRHRRARTPVGWCWPATGSASSRSTCAEDAGGLRFASTLPALLAGGGVDTSIDPVALHHYLSLALHRAGAAHHPRRACKRLARPRC